MKLGTLVNVEFLCYQIMCFPKWRPMVILVVISSGSFFATTLKYSSAFVQHRISFYLSLLEIILKVQKPMEEKVQQFSICFFLWRKISIFQLFTREKIYSISCSAFKSFPEFLNKLKLKVIRCEIRALEHFEGITKNETPSAAIMEN